MSAEYLRREKQAILRKSRDLGLNRINRTAERQFRAFYWGNNYHRNTRGESMSFVDMHYLTHLYLKIGNCPRMVVEKSVQMGLSELFIIQSHIEAGERGLTIMYVLPKYELRNRFVNNRIYKLHGNVEHYKNLMKSASTQVHRAALMHFGKGTMAFVGSNVETEFIEMPIDSAYVDEKDRCDPTNLLLLPDRYSASPHQFHREISNPTVEGYGIDERYQKSSQALWYIKCPRCGERFSPDWFTDMIEETASNIFRVRDTEWEPGREPRLVHGKCGAPVDRLAEGEWVPAFPDREWKGFRINKLYGKFTHLSQLVEDWNDAQGNPLKIQVFYNSQLGLPFTSKGSKITKDLLEGIRAHYKFPAVSVRQEHPRFMGVDIGKDLNVVIRERVQDAGEKKLRLIYAARVPSYNAVAALIREWKPKRVVIDAEPEIHKNIELKAEFGVVFTSKFQEGLIKMLTNRKDRHVTMDRTAAIDGLHAAVANGMLINPWEAGHIDNGEYYRNMESSTRILEVNETNKEKSRYVWVHSRPDHYMMAEVYCAQAAEDNVGEGIFEFFAGQAEIVKTVEHQKVEDSSRGGLSEDQAEEVLRLQQISPDAMLARVREADLKPRMTKPRVNDKAIQRTIETLWGTSQYVDLMIAAQMSQEHEDDVRRILLKLGYSESRIKGQWVK